MPSAHDILSRILFANIFAGIFCPFLFLLQICLESPLKAYCSLPCMLLSTFREANCRIGCMQIELHREIEGKIKTLTIKKEAGIFCPFLFLLQICLELPLKAYCSLPCMLLSTFREANCRILLIT